MVRVKEVMEVMVMQNCGGIVKHSNAIFCEDRASKGQLCLSWNPLSNSVCFVKGYVRKLFKNSTIFEPSYSSLASAYS